MSWTQEELEFNNPVNDVKTVPGILYESSKSHSSITAQMYKNSGRERYLFDFCETPESKKYGEISYSELWNLITQIASGLQNIGVDSDERVGIFSTTRAEWIHSFVGAQLAGCTSSVIYSVSNSEQLKYLLSDAEVTTLFIGNEKLMSKFSDVSDETSVNNIILFDRVDNDYYLSVNSYTLSDLYKRGNETNSSELISSIDGDDLTAILYTSGTTGDPKGVCFDHKSYVAAVRQVVDRIGPRPDKSTSTKSLDPGDRVFSFMPLSHSFEQLAHFSEFACGATIAYAESEETIKEDIEKIEPFAMPTFPEMFEKIYNAIKKRAQNSESEEKVFQWAAEIAQRYSKQNQPDERLSEKHNAADELIFRQVRRILGGELDVIVSGGGVLTKDLARFFDACGFTILEGYGMTETLGALSLNPPEDTRIKTIGQPLSKTEIKIKDSAKTEISTDSTEPDVGELLMRGPQLASGYLEEGEITSFVNQDGWYHTGDFVERDGNGYLKFVGRKNNMFQLENRLYVFPHYIERKVEKHSEIKYCVILGEGRMKITALIMPDTSNVTKDLCNTNSNEINSIIKSVINNVNNKLSSRERISEFEIISGHWSRGGKYLTPTNKKRREVIKEDYNKEVRSLLD